MRTIATLAALIPALVLADAYNGSPLLPGTKVDTHPISVPANQAVTAVEFNNAMQGIADARSAIQSGQTVDLRTCAPVGDGTTDDTTALQVCLTRAATAKKFLFMPPPSVSYRITSGLTVGAPGVIGAGSNSSIVKVDFSGTAMTVTSNATRIQGIQLINGPSGANLYTGILLNGASFGFLEDVNVQGCLKGYVLQGQSYWNTAKGITTAFALEGIHFLTSAGFAPNNNNFSFNQLNGPGPGVANSYGFIDEGQGNKWTGGEAGNVLWAFWLSGSNTDVRNLFTEACNNNFKVTGTGTHSVTGFNSNLTAQPTIATTAKVYGFGPTDLGQYQHMKQPRISFNGLTGLWLFNENAGNAGVSFRDWSGNGRSGSSGGSSPIWDQGEWGPVYREDPLHSGNTAAVPTSAFTFSAPFTVAALARMDDGFPSGGPYTQSQPIVTFYTNSSNWTEIGFQVAGGTEVQQDVSGTATQVSIVSSANPYASGKYFWVVVGLDPANPCPTGSLSNGCVYFLDPYLGYTYQHMSLASLSGTTSVPLLQNNGTFSGKGSIAYLATWNRLLNMSEVYDLVNAKTPPIPPVPSPPFTATITGTSFFEATPFDAVYFSTDDAIRSFQFMGGTYSGRPVTFCDASGSVTGSHTMTVFPSSGNIDGSSTFVITPGTNKCVTAVSDGTNYWIKSVH